MDPISSLLKPLNDPKHYLYHPARLAYCSGITYIMVELFTATSALEGATFMGIVYTVSQITLPIFTYFAEPYAEYPLGPFFGQLANLTLANLVANGLCYVMFGAAFTLEQVLIFNALFVIGLMIYYFVRAIFREISRTPPSELLF